MTGIGIQRQEPAVWVRWLRGSRMLEGIACFFAFAVGERVRNVVRDARTSQRVCSNKRFKCGVDEWCVEVGSSQGAPHAINQGRDFKRSLL